MAVAAGLRNRGIDVVGVFPANHPWPALGYQPGPQLANLVDVASLRPRFAGILPHHDADREVRPSRVDIRYRPLVNRSIAVSDIEQVKARTYKPIQEYGGWGIRGWPGQRIAYNVSGDQGVELLLRDGRSVMIGSQQPETLALAISAQLGRG